MSAHRRTPRTRPALRRALAAAVLAIATGAGYLAAAGPAQAAGPWFAGTGGSNAANCLSLATRCATVSGVLAKAGFVSGDTINVSAGTYADHPAFTTKGAKIVGAGAGSTVFDGSGTTWAMAVNGAITVELRELTLTNGAFVNAGAPGGALPILGNATVSTTNVAVTNSKSSLGGAIGVAAGSTLSMTGGSLTGNTATNAGALFNNGTSTLDGTTVTGNTANGGATTNGGNGGAIYNANKLTLKNATLTGNKVVANTNATPGITGYGGSIFSANLAANAPSVTLTDTGVNGGAVAGGNAVIGGAIAVYPSTVGGTTSKVDGTRLTLSKNVAQAGGGLLSYGNVTLTDSVVEQNSATHASAGAGGGIYLAAAGTTNPALTLDSTDLVANTAATSGGGAYVAAGGTATIRNTSQVTQNAAAVGAGVHNAGTTTVREAGVLDNDASNSGGGLYSTGSLTVQDSAVAENTAAFLAGGIGVAGPLTVTGGQINRNSAFNAGGVFVADAATATLDGTVLGGNTATGSGGGALLNSGRTTITRSSLLDNRAVHPSGNAGLGGAIYSGSGNNNVTTTLKVGSSTIAGNHAYAGSALITYSPGSGAVNTTSIDNTTITGNHSASAFGAIEQLEPMTITSSTIAGNTATDPDGDEVGGLAMFAPAQVGIAGSIVDGNSGSDCSGAVDDGGHNLGNDSACGFSATENDVTGSPQLGALANNGGPTQTRKPGPSSPALDWIPATTATGLNDAVTGSAVTLCGAGALDQRGTARPQGARCDIGAVEADALAPTVAGPAEADYTVGSAGAPVEFTSTGSPQPSLSASGDLPAGVTFTDNGDGTGTLSGTPGPNTGGEHGITITATNAAGSDDLSFTLKVHQAPKLTGPAATTYTVGQPGGPDVFEQTEGYPEATLSTGSDLPDGVTFTPQSGGKGQIAGTPAAGTGGVYPITVTGSNGTAPDASWPFELTVDEAPGIDGPSPVTFTAGVPGASGDYTASGFPVPTFSADGLPPGLTVQSTGAGTARISGTAADGTGGEYDVTLTADNGVGEPAGKTVHLVVNEAPELTGPTMARFVAGRDATIGYLADGYPGAALSIEGDLPEGLTFTDNGDGSGTIGGTATEAALGSHPVTVRASNGIDPDATLELTIEVVPPPSITTTSLPNAAIGTAYSATVGAIGGQPAYTFSLESGSLPAGLTLGSDGQITGSPTGPTGTSTFTVKVTDSDVPAQSDTQELSITVGRGATTLSVNPVVLQLNPLGLRVGIVKATLTGGFPAQPLANQTVVFKAGATTVCTGLTGADGTVICKLDVIQTLQVVLMFGVTGSYGGNATWLPSSGSAGLIG